MKRKYKPRTLSGAARKVAHLEMQIEILSLRWESFAKDRIQLAKLAAKGPVFFNPLEVMAAEKLRDSILDQIGMRPDGTFKKAAK